MIQPFIPGSNDIDQQLYKVVSRLAPGIELGHVQLIPSPWSEERAFLAVTGTTDEGLKGATRILADSPKVLSNNLSLVKDREVGTIDTRGLTRGGMAAAAATAVPEMYSATATLAAISIATSETTIVAASSLAPLRLRPTPGNLDKEQPSDATGRSVRHIPSLGVTGLIALAVFVLAIRRVRQRGS